MADNGRWFKLWCDSDDDDALDSLSISDFGRWAKLGAYVKSHGTNGEAQITEPARTLCAKFQVSTFSDLMECISRFPNVILRSEKSPVTLVTIASVTFRNWSKYQGDYSGDRVRKFRSVKRPKRRGEEKRREEIRKEENKECMQRAEQVRLSADGSWEGIDPLKVEVWKKAYPGVDVNQELSKMVAWANANPAKRKKNWARFIVSWLSKAQEQTTGGRQAYGQAQDDWKTAFLKKTGGTHDTR